MKTIVTLTEPERQNLLYGIDKFLTNQFPFPLIDTVNKFSQDKTKDYSKESLKDFMVRIYRIHPNHKYLFSETDASYYYCIIQMFYELQVGNVITVDLGIDEDSGCPEVKYYAIDYLFRYLNSFLFARENIMDDIREVCENRVGDRKVVDTVDPLQIYNENVKFMDMIETVDTEYFGEYQITRESFGTWAGFLSTFKKIYTEGVLQKE